MNDLVDPTGWHPDVDREPVLGDPQWRKVLLGEPGWIGDIDAVVDMDPLRSIKRRTVST